MKNAFEQTTAVEERIMPSAVAAVEKALQCEIILIENPIFQKIWGDGIACSASWMRGIDFKNRPQTYAPHEMLVEIYSNRSRRTLGWGPASNAMLVAEYRADSNNLVITHNLKDWLNRREEIIEQWTVGDQTRIIDTTIRIGEKDYKLMKQEKTIQMNDTWFIVVPTSDLLDAGLLVYEYPPAV